MAQQDLLRNVYSIATSTGDDQSNLASFLVKMNLIVKGEQDFTFIIDDALNNSVRLLIQLLTMYGSTFNKRKMTIKSHLKNMNVLLK